MQTDQEAVHDGRSGWIRLRTVHEVAQDIFRVSTATVYELIYQRQLEGQESTRPVAHQRSAIVDFLGETEEVAR